MTFVNFNNKDQNKELRYNAKVISEALYQVETKNTKKINSIVESIKEPLSIENAISLFENKVDAYSALQSALLNHKEEIDESSVWPKSDLGDSFDATLSTVLDREFGAGKYHVVKKDIIDSDTNKKIMTVKGNDSAQDIAKKIKKKVNEGLNEAKSINKIQKEWTKVTQEMKETVSAWKKSKGQEKEKLKDKLKELTNTKKELEVELDKKVGLKDVDAELVGEAYTEDDINTGYGFYGTINREEDDKTTRQLFDRSVKDLMKEFKISEKEALVVLNSRMGRKAADQIIDGQSKTAVDALKDYYGKSLKKDMDKVIAANEGLNWDSLIEKINSTSIHDVAESVNEADFGKPANGDYSDEMSHGQLERCIDYATMIRERIEKGTSLDPWMHSQIAVAENELNSVWDAVDGDDGVVEAKETIKKGSVVIPYAHDKYGEFVVDRVFKNKDGETSYTGKFKESGEEREFILHRKDKIVKESMVEQLELTEGVMSDLHRIAGEVKDEEEFVKQFFKEYGDKINKNAESTKWVKSLYKDTVNESAKPGGWIAYIEYPRGKKLVKVLKSHRAAVRWNNKNIDDILMQDGVKGVGIMSKEVWDKTEAQYAIESVVTEAKGLDRDEMLIWLEDYIEEISTSEEFNNTRGNIWINASNTDLFNGDLIYNYYSKKNKKYENKVLKEWEEELNKRGWHSTWYDSDNVLIKQS